MSAPAFTPAPWEFESEDNGDARGRWLVAGSDYLAMVCRRATVEEETANARLIAAAPDLYAALNACVAAGCLDEFQQHIAERVLAKARGETL